MPAFIQPFADFNPHKFRLMVTCADGLESALLIELASFGLTGEMLRAGRIVLWVNLVQFYHICLYSRVASRVLLPIGEYYFKTKAQTTNQVTTDAKGKKITRTLQTEVVDEDVPEALYAFVGRYDWTSIFEVENTFAVRLSTDKRLTVNQQFAMLRIKDAIADSFNRQLGKRPDVDSKTPDIHIFTTANSRFAELFLDLSGVSLHRRGYRVMNTDAPLKENLAAALLYESGWHTKVHDALIDPMCGSGTFITEALLMRADYPVGLDKAHNQFGFFAWRYHDEALWEQLVAEASEKFHANLESMVHTPLTVLALDADAYAVHACHKNMLAAGLGRLIPSITLVQSPLSKLKDILASLQATHPLIITNPPYGERLGERDFIQPLYQGLGLQVVDGLVQAGIMQASMAVLAAHVEHADTLPIIDPKTLRCHNGALTVYFRYGKLNLTPADTLIASFEKKVLEPAENAEFTNRLQKNLAHLKKLAKVHEVSNLRVYDADLPNYNVAIDIYGDKVHVQEYAPPKQIVPEIAKARFNLVLAGVRAVLGVSRESIFIKTRARQSGNEQYTKIASDKRQKRYIARELGAYFYVNFTDYLDTGLFIDHRNMRAMIRQASRGKRVLNLFAYTCSASVQAALGGAKSVTSVDLSGNYLDWGRQNFAVNGLVLDAWEAGTETPKYQFIEADVFEWIKNHTEQYEVIFIDPPTFSNSKKFYGTFDVQRDHVALINRAMNRLTSDGVLYFSNNFTKFVLDNEIKNRYEVVEITDKTIGFDFNPKKPIHQSFMICHKQGIGASKVSNNTAKSTAGVFGVDDFEVVNFEMSDKDFMPQKTDRTKHRNNDRINNSRIYDDGYAHDKCDKERHQRQDKQGLAKTSHRKSSQGKKQSDITKKPTPSRVRSKKDVSDAFDEKPAIKVRYEKINGQMVKVTSADETHASEQKPNKYQVKKKIDKAALSSYEKSSKK